MYLTLDIGLLAVIVVWFVIGLNVLRKTPMIHDPLAAFHRYHPRLVPFLALLLIAFWPITKVICRLVDNYISTQNNKS